MNYQYYWPGVNYWIYSKRKPTRGGIREEGRSMSSIITITTTNFFLFRFSLIQGYLGGFVGLVQFRSVGIGKPQEEAARFRERNEERSEMGSILGGDCTGSRRRRRKRTTRRETWDGKVLGLERHDLGQGGV